MVLMLRCPQTFVIYTYTEETVYCVSLYPTLYPHSLFMCACWNKCIRWSSNSRVICYYLYTLRLKNSNKLYLALSLGCTIRCTFGTSLLHCHINVVCFLTELGYNVKPQGQILYLKLPWVIHNIF